MKIRRIAFIKLCLWLTIAACGTAIAIRVSRVAEEPIRGDMFAMIAPLFLVMTASKTHRFPRTSVVMSVAGLALGVLTLLSMIR